MDHVMMNRVSAIIILLFLFTTSLPAKTKTQVKGFATSGFVPVVNMLVSAVDTTGTVVATTRSDEQGNFTLRLPNGQYTLTFQCTGYRNTKREISVQGKDIEMHIMMRLGEELRAASITAKNLLKKQSDRYVYDVSRDMEKNDISMTAMMMKLPEVLKSTTDGKLEYMGTPVTKIIIDDEDNGFINVDRQYPMEFIKASYMKTIELILPGSPQYNNTSPIIHIKLSRPLPYGFAGALTLKENTNNSHSPSTDVVTNIPFIGLGFRYTPFYSHGREMSERTLNEFMDGTVWESETTSRSRSYGHSMNVNAFKKFFDENVTLNASVGTSFSKSNSQNTSTTNSSLQSAAYGETVSPYHLNLALSLNGSFGPNMGRKQKQYLWKLEYSYINTSGESMTEHRLVPDSTWYQTAYQSQKEHRLVGKIDRLYLEKLHLHGNMKAGWFGRDFSNSTDYPYNQGMSYRQNVSFVEIRMFTSVLEKLSTSLTLKGEHVSDIGSYQQNGGFSPLDYQEFSLIPYLSLTYEINKIQNFGISYSQNVKRPSINQLNPYVDVIDPLNRKTGNPQLKGSKTNSFRINYSYRPQRSLSVNLGGNYSTCSDEINSLTIFGADGIATRTYANIGKTDMVGAHFSVDYRPNRSWSFSLSTDYSDRSATLPNGTVNRYAQPSGRFSTTWKNKFFSMTGRLSLNPSFDSIQTGKLIMEPRMYLSIARYFEKPKIGININTDDVLHTYRSRYESVIKYDNYIQHQYKTRPGRIVNFTLYWYFGKFRQTNEPLIVDAYDMQ